MKRDAPAVSKDEDALVPADLGVSIPVYQDVPRSADQDTPTPNKNASAPADGDTSVLNGDVVVPVAVEKEAQIAADKNALAIANKDALIPNKDVSAPADRNVPTPANRVATIPANRDTLAAAITNAFASVLFLVFCFSDVAFVLLICLISKSSKMGNCLLCAKRAYFFKLTNVSLLSLISPFGSSIK